ncbi:dTMP kinase [Kribbella sp. NPDC056861]|uniref:dTMP kinase n=1 Tax=Kribbella sp. NPDC056861 TaxID=3154857 RepID=UPI00344656AF
MTPASGGFIAIEGPSGVGKSTLVGLLTEELRQRGLRVVSTKEPTDSNLGKMARNGTREFSELTLACLVVADRYHHLEQTIRPAISDGAIIVCDRYVPSTLVLQQMDGIDPGFLWALNQYADPPDLTIVLSGNPELSKRRALQRGIYSRFHAGDAEAEHALYQQVSQELEQANWNILQRTVAEESAAEVLADLLPQILDHLPERLT